MYLYQNMQSLSRDQHPRGVVHVLVNLQHADPEFTMNITVHYWYTLYQFGQMNNDMIHYDSIIQSIFSAWISSVLPLLTSFP